LAPPDATIKCVEAARNYGPRSSWTWSRSATSSLAKAVERMGASYIGIHIAIDEQMQGKTPWIRSVRWRRPCLCPSRRRGINLRRFSGDQRRLIVGRGAITRPTLHRHQIIKRTIETLVPSQSEFFVRATGPDVRDKLARVSAANVSDALHRTGDIPGLRPLAPGSKLVGPALTVRTYPGDWAKPVEAIDHAQPGDVIVIDAGGVPPAIWGELATNSALQRGVAGVVIFGGARDTGDIRALGLPLFCSLVTPTAGERGFR
jgi:3-hexulose-6-phosphate synthase/6-phospho-3-hexuloisomerase